MPRNLKAQKNRRLRRLRIDFDPHLDRTKSVAGSNVEIAKHLQGLGEEERLRLVVGQARAAIKAIRLDLYFCFVLQLEYSLRISEVLAIKQEDITYWGEVRIHGKKGSRDRFISSDTCREYLLKTKHLGIRPFAELNDSFVRRQYKKAGLIWRAPGREKDSITHIFRHIAAMSARSNNFGNQVITDRLGHKSKKTQENYGR